MNDNTDLGPLTFIFIVGLASIFLFMRSYAEKPKKDAEINSSQEITETKNLEDTEEDGFTSFSFANSSNTDKKSKDAFNPELVPDKDRFVLIEQGKMGGEMAYHLLKDKISGNVWIYIKRGDSFIFELFEENKEEIKDDIKKTND